MPHHAVRHEIFKRPIMLQLLKAFLPIKLTVGERVTVVSATHFSKALSPMRVSPSGKVTLSNPLKL